MVVSIVSLLLCMTIALAYEEMGEIESVSSSIPFHLLRSLDEPIVYKFGQRAFETETQSASKALVWFVSRLNSLIDESGLLLDEFKEKSEFMEKDLSEITAWVLKLPKSRELSRQLNFSSDFFGSMKDYQSIAEYFSEDTMELYLLRNMAQANLMLLSLFDPYGSPNSELKDFQYKVARIHATVDFQAKVFEHIADRQSGVIFTFKDMFHRVKQTLQKLEASEIETSFVMN